MPLPPVLQSAAAARAGLAAVAGGGVMRAFVGLLQLALALYVTDEELCDSLAAPVVSGDHEGMLASALTSQHWQHSRCRQVCFLALASPHGLSLMSPEGCSAPSWFHARLLAKGMGRASALPIADAAYVTRPTGTLDVLDGDTDRRSWHASVKTC